MIAHRRSGLLLFPTVALIAACGSEPDPTPAQRSVDGPSTLSPGRPNVVWIVLDALRPDHLGTYGYERDTSPNIDTLAARGVVFERNFAQGPNTLQSVQSYMTGRLAPVSYHYAGALGNWFLREPPDDEKPISTILGDNGYATAMFSASPWYPRESRLGGSFDTFGPLAHRADVIGASYAERNPQLFRWLQSRAERPDDPFFLYLHSLDTHGPRYANNTDSRWLDPGFSERRDERLRGWARSAMRAEGGFTDEDRKRLIDLYDGGVAYADTTVGEILRFLEGEALSANTLVILTSDHGELIAEDGRSLGHPAGDSSDTLLHVPLIMAGAGLPEGRRIDVTTQSADIVPTIVDLLAFETSARFDGVSLRSVVQSDRPVPLHEYAYARTWSLVFSGEPNRVLIYEDIKLDFNPYTEEQWTEAARFGLPRRPPMLAYAMPDESGNRRIVEPTSEQLERARAALDDRLIPLWNARLDRPKETPPMFPVRLFELGNLDSISPEPDRRDGLWSRVNAVARHAFDGVETLYVAHPATEEVDPLFFEPEVPDGTYAVRLKLKTVESPRGHQAVSVRVWTPRPGRPGDAEAPRLLRLEPPSPDEQASKWFDLGKHDVTGGVFPIRIATGNADDVSAFGGLLFEVPSDDRDGLNEEHLRKQEARLRALGYLD